MSVRRLGPGDEGLLGEILREFRGYAAPDTARFLDDPSSVAFVIEADGNVAGWGYGTVIERPEGRLSLLIYEIEVKPEYRGRSYGTELVEAFKSEALTLGCLRLWTLTESNNSRAQRLYQTNGARIGSTQELFIWDLTDRG